MFSVENKNMFYKIFILCIYIFSVYLTDCHTFGTSAINCSNNRYCWPFVIHSWLFMIYSIVGRSWYIVGCSWYILGYSWYIVGCSRYIRYIFGCSWYIVGCSWYILGCSWKIDIFPAVHKVSHEIYNSTCDILYSKPRNTCFLIMLNYTLTKKCTRSNYDIV